MEKVIVRSSSDHNNYNYKLPKQKQREDENNEVENVRQFKKGILINHQSLPLPLDETDKVLNGHGQIELEIEEKAKMRQNCEDGSRDCYILLQRLSEMAKNNRRSDKLYYNENENESGENPLEAQPVHYYRKKYLGEVVKISNILNEQINSIQNKKICGNGNHNYENVNNFNNLSKEDLNGLKICYCRSAVYSENAILKKEKEKEISSKEIERIKSGGDFVVNPHSNTGNAKDIIQTLDIPYYKLLKKSKKKVEFDVIQKREEIPKISKTVHFAPGTSFYERNNSSTFWRDILNRKRQRLMDRRINLFNMYIIKQYEDRKRYSNYRDRQNRSSLNSPWRNLRTFFGSCFGLKKSDQACKPVKFTMNSFPY